jgi:tRNA(Ile)-lysidine synthase
VDRARRGLTDPAPPQKAPPEAAPPTAVPAKAVFTDTGPAFHAVRRAVRAWLAAHALSGQPVAVGLSGGPDSLALTAAAVREAPLVRALIVDHQLQEGSAEVARRAAAAAAAAGCAEVAVLRVDVSAGGGLEAAARAARYTALDGARNGAPVLLAHTLDDQAETVLLGLARGSGPRSIAGMAAWREPWGRPLLGLRREVTHAACAELALEPFHDPQNHDPRFTRARLRHEVLPLLEDVLGGGAALALARTAELLVDDIQALDELATAALRRAARSGPTGASLDASALDASALDISVLGAEPRAVRRRVLRLWLREAGAADLAMRQLTVIDDLVGDWRGQGPVAVSMPGQPATARVVVRRVRGSLVICADPRPDAAEGRS